MFGQKKDLFELNIVHSLPGRIRLNCKAIEYFNEFNEQILQDIIDLGFVKKVTINNITKNIDKKPVATISRSYFRKLNTAL